MHWGRVGGDRIQGQGCTEDKTHLGNAFAKNRYLLTWALRVTKSRMEAWHQCLLSVALCLLYFG